VCDVCEDGVASIEEEMEEMIEKDSARIGRSRVVDQSTSRPNWRMNVRVNEMWEVVTLSSLARTILHIFPL